MFEPSKRTFIRLSEKKKKKLKQNKTKKQRNKRKLSIIQKLCRKIAVCGSSVSQIASSSTKDDRD